MEFSVDSAAGDQAAPDQYVTRPIRKYENTLEDTPVKAFEQTTDPNPYW